MNKYCIVEKNFKENHAGSKARADVAEILTKNNWHPIVVHHNQTDGTAEKLKMLPLTFFDWMKVERNVPGDSQLLIQYPLAMFPKVSTMALPFIRRMKEKNVRMIFLIHDLDSLRGINEPVERAFLTEADIIIAHNERMAEYLKNHGYGQKDIRILGMFDYLLFDEAFSYPQVTDRHSVVIAGNLNQIKAGYVYDLDTLKGDSIRFLLYGPNYNGPSQTGKVKYAGQFTPEELPKKLNGSFGLVWDGESMDTCLGAYGDYLKYNNPHKTSLYLVSGMPVIVWEQSAIAQFVQQQQIGFAVNKLSKIHERIDSLTQEEYMHMRKNAQAIGKKLSEGKMLLDVLSRL